MAERWRPIAGYEGLYEVSDRGRVRSFHRCAAGKLMSPGLRGNGKDGGYWCVDLKRNGTLLRCRINRLVLTAFVGPPLSPVHEAAHRDGNSRCNELSNLAWLTPAENNGEKKLHGTMVWGSRHGRAKMTESGVRAMRAEYIAGATPLELAAKNGVQVAAVHKILRRDAWRHV